MLDWKIKKIKKKKGGRGNKSVNNFDDVINKTVRDENYEKIEDHKCTSVDVWITWHLSTQVCQST